MDADSIPITLRKVLKYRNKDLLDRFCAEFDISRRDARRLFQETLKWIWLCAEARKARKAGRHVPTLIVDQFLAPIDEMWHNFILHTKEYARFCDTHFGFLVHHSPTPPRIKRGQKTRFAASSSEFEQQLEKRRKQFGYIYDQLGPSTLIRWYGSLAAKHANLARRAKPPLNEAQTPISRRNIRRKGI